MNIQKILILFSAAFFLLPPLVNAQYFGRNKPRYEDFNFELLETEHFDIYHYLNNHVRLRELAEQSEEWYCHHQHIFHDTFPQPNPIIFYNDHADFQQTNAIMGLIGSGTGGVTEGLKNRVVMPIAMSNQQTHHVLGHELVHAFQYHMVLGGDSTSIRNLQNLPLWMVEGLAEYLSIGRVDPHTAMWMRDAVMNEDVPSIKKLNNPKYFPYRWGQAFWAFVTSIYGDEVIEPLFMATAKLGLEEAIRTELGISMDTLSDRWVNLLKEHYRPMVEAKEREKIKGRLLFEDLPGRITVSPKVSPDGRYVIFLSEKDLFGLDLFLADARKGKIIRKVFSTTREGHIDEYNNIESAGTWSPDSRQFATVAFLKGKNALIIKEVLTGKTVLEKGIPGVPAFTNPTWSADGQTIVVTGLVNGQVDLYAYNIESGEMRQLTDDKYSEMHPEFSPNGQELVFATDELSHRRGRSGGRLAFNLAVLDLTTGATELLDPFPGADNLNPVFDREGNILFLSNCDGYRDLYQLERRTGRVYQLTKLKTGISGITHYAPALSVGQMRDRDRVMYSVYQKGGYVLVKDYLEDFERREVDAAEVDLSPAMLPLITREGMTVTQRLSAMSQLYEIDTTTFSERPYEPRFRLDYIGGGAGVGIGNNSVFGTQAGMAGGVDMLFGDMLGNQQLYAGLNVNGQVYDFGGQVAYVNRKKPIIWGASVSHIPYRTGRFLNGSFDTIRIDDELVEAFNQPTDLIRLFEDRLSVFAQKPFSQSLRVEAGASFALYNYRIERFNNYFTPDGQFFLGSTREVQEAPPGFGLGSFNAALVGDNSYFGLASPMEGYRFRFGAERFFGHWDFYQVTADYRRYFYTRPVSFAVRGLHIGRYGQDAGGLAPYYLGSQSLIHGYNVLAVSGQEENGITFDELTGSRLMVANAEVRLPFTGPGQIALIPSNLLFTELALFFDGGVAFNRFSDFGSDTEGTSLEPRPLFSTGVSLRVNLFGALILEPYYAWQLRENGRAVFGMNIVPGW